jgi:DMSO/TMAO reductase YedYZ molybdopterin-dependent catalytic subunit
MTKLSKLIEEKIKKAANNSNQNSTKSNNRLPPGQTITEKFPVLDLGIKPDINQSNWTLKIFGLVENELNINFEELQTKFEQVEETSDFHCVTHWSKYDVCWRGIRPRELFLLVKPKTNAKFITFHSYDGYTTNLPLSALLDDDVLIAYGYNGQSLELEHGGPVRTVVPKRFAWKSAKWIKAIEIHEEDRPGFWEVRGYHNEADPWKEERFS